MAEPEQLRELAKRRGLFFQSQEAYGGSAGFYTYGPEGAKIKRNVENSWRDLFSRREGNMELDSPTVMEEDVFRASGHLEGFDDLIVDCGDCGSSHRADHLVEEAGEIEDAEGLPPGEISELLEDNGVDCPDCGSPLGDSEVEEFNLMFETSIGPGAAKSGYLRPETAQGIFVEFPRLLEYARGKMPFGVTQVGRAYRNEISPRRGLVRTREFTQAELELFFDPEGEEPELGELKEEELTLYPRERQESGEGAETMKAGEALERGLIESPRIAYYLALSKIWFQEIGVDLTRFRFRQHMEDELSHYASDCWDAETEIGGEWLEVAGFAYRGCYDLEKHDKYSREDFTAFRQFEEPERVERTEVDVDMSAVGPRLGDLASEVEEELEAALDRDPEIAEKNSVELEIDGQEVTLDSSEFEVRQIEKEVSGEQFMPHVVEPSFGIDRTVYSVLLHSLETDTVDGEERTVLRLEPGVAPREVAVLPLMDSDGMGEKAAELEERLAGEGFDTARDSSGSIGRRYRRQDEVGTPYCVTVDHQSLEDGTVTVRDRDSTEQRRFDSEELGEVLQELISGADLQDL